MNVRKTHEGAEGARAVDIRQQQAENGVAVFETPTDDAGNIYFDTGYFADELPDSSQYMPEYKFTVTGACMRVCVFRRKIIPSPSMCSVLTEEPCRNVVISI